MPSSSHRGCEGSAPCPTGAQTQNLSWPLSPPPHQSLCHPKGLMKKKHLLVPPCAFSLECLLFMAIPVPLRPPPLVRTLPPFKAKCKLVTSSIRGAWVHHQPRCLPWSPAFCVSLVALMWFCYVSGSCRCAVPPTWDCEPP